jgi:hypothetical protein
MSLITSEFSLHVQASTVPRGHSAKSPHSKSWNVSISILAHVKSHVKPLSKYHMAQSGSKHGKITMKAHLLVPSRPCSEPTRFFASFELENAEQWTATRGTVTTERLWNFIVSCVLAKNVWFPRLIAFGVVCSHKVEGVLELHDVWDFPPKLIWRNHCPNYKCIILHPHAFGMRMLHSDQYSLISAHNFHLQITITSMDQTTPKPYHYVWRLRSKPTSLRDFNVRLELTNIHVEICWLVYFVS